LYFEDPRCIKMTYKTVFPFHRVKRLMREHHPRVSDAAVIKMDKILAQTLEDVMKKSIQAMKYAHRNTIFPQDIDVSKILPLD